MERYRNRFTEEQEALILRVEDVFEQFKNDDMIHITDKYIDNYGTLVIRVSGGKNGNGLWSSYLNNLANIITELINKGIDCWFIKGINDCVDDVFNMTFGIKKV